MSGLKVGKESTMINDTDPLITIIAVQFRSEINETVSRDLFFLPTMIWIVACEIVDFWQYSLLYTTCIWIPISFTRDSTSTIPQYGTM